MTFLQFKDDPWRKSHEAYRGSTLAVNPAPEYASSEVVISSLYRHIGFKDSSEATVPTSGRELAKKIQKFRNCDKMPSGAVLDAGTIDKLIHSVLESPKLPNQSSKRFIQDTPLVPQIGLFSGSARLSSNSWSAGALVKRMVWLGSKTREDAKRTWHSLFVALSVSQDEDDIFARFLQDELGTWMEGDWKEFDPGELPILDEEDRRSLHYPARIFVKDLEAVIAAKPTLTRRQWTSVLEAIVRLASVAHVVWLCEVQSRIWTSLRDAMAGRPPAEVADTKAQIYPAQFQFLAYGDRALPGIKDRTSSYLRARLGINATLWKLEELGHPVASLASAKDVFDLCTEVSRDEFPASSLLGDLEQVKERENRALLCKKGIGSNLQEFARHILGQRQAANALLRGYDQGYILKKSGSSNASPWVVNLGPVAVLALVHCALAGTTGMRSIHRLSKHLAEYGVRVDHNEIATNDLGQQLRMLGIVLDSPDAESGMLLVPPFPKSEKAAA